MPTRDNPPIGAPCWVDLLTSNPEQSRAFYTAVFGWECEKPNEEFGGYFNFSKDGVLVAGGFPSSPGAPPDTWSIYLATDDAEKTLESAVAHGGQVAVPAMAVADLGVMAHVIDPGGASIGVWQPGLHKGFGVFGEPNTPGWFELHTRDHAKSVDFYRDVFRWETQAAGDSDDFRYTVQTVGDEQHAGIMDATAFLPDGVGAYWSVYFGAEKTDAALETIVAHGGRVIEPAMDTPYGRLATAADPGGVTFKLVGA